MAENTPDLTPGQTSPSGLGKIDVDGKPVPGFVAKMRAKNTGVPASGKLPEAPTPPEPGQVSKEMARLFKENIDRTIAAENAEPAPTVEQAVTPPPPVEPPKPPDIPPPAATPEPTPVPQPETSLPLEQTRQQIIEEVQKVRQALADAANRVQSPLNVSDALPPAVQENIRQDWERHNNKLSAGEKKTVETANQAADETNKWERYLSKQEEVDTQLQRLKDARDMARKTRAGYSASEATPANKGQLTMEVKRTEKEFNDFVMANIPSALWGDMGVPSEVIVDKKHILIRDPLTPQVNDFLDKQENWRQFILDNQQTPENAAKNDASQERELRRQALAEQVRLQQENERLQKELADAKRTLLNQKPITEEDKPAAEPEPALEVDNLEPEPVDTRNRLERIRDGVAIGLRNWWENLDPRRWREKDLAWRVGAVAGVAEGVTANLLPIPGGRLAVNAMNFLVAQGAYVGGEALRQREIANIRAEQGTDVNDQVDRMLDVNDRYRNFSRNMGNLLLGMSAGMTYTSVAGMAWSLVEGAWNTGTGAVLPPGPEAPLPTAPGGPEGAGIKIPGLPQASVTITEHGNFWKDWRIIDKAFAPDWTDLNNGVRHTDVIKDMVVKLARHNGHELGLVHAGDQIKFAEILTPEQLELVKKAAGAKSYNEYLTAVRPLYRAALGK